MFVYVIYLKKDYVNILFISPLSRIYRRKVFHLPSVCIDILKPSAQSSTAFKCRCCWIFRLVQCRNTFTLKIFFCVAALIKSPHLHFVFFVSPCADGWNKSVAHQHVCEHENKIYINSHSICTWMHQVATSSNSLTQPEDAFKVRVLLHDN